MAGSVAVCAKARLPFRGIIFQEDGFARPSTPTCAERIVVEHKTKEEQTGWENRSISASNGSEIEGKTVKVRFISLLNPYKPFI